MNFKLIYTVNINYLHKDILLCLLLHLKFYSLGIS